MTSELYKEFILDLYRNPLNKKELKSFDVEKRELNHLCGDDITIQLKFDEKGNVSDIGFSGHGCAISEAATSVLTDEIKGKSINQIKKMTQENIFKLLGMKVVYTRLKCATLSLKAIHDAIEKYENK